MTEALAVEIPRAVDNLPIVMFAYKTGHLYSRVKEVPYTLGYTPKNAKNDLVQQGTVEHPIQMMFSNL